MSLDSANNDHSPQSPVNGAAASAAVNSPQARRRSLSSPWASVVRGDSETISSPTATGAAGSSSPPPIAAEQQGSDNAPPPVPDSSGSGSGSGHEAQPEGLDVNGEGNVDRQRRPAWNRQPVNGVVEPESVMGGAVSWPALSDATRPMPRSAAGDLTRQPVADGSTSSSQGPIISNPPQRQGTTNTHTHSAANNTNTGRQPRSRHHHRSGGSSGNNVSSSGTVPSPGSPFPRPSPPTPPPFPVLEMPYGPMIPPPPMLDTPIRGPVPRPGSQTHSGNDHSSQRGNSRRGNYGNRPRGDGQFHNHNSNSHGGGGRRDQDRRDVHLPPQQYVPPPPPMGFMYPVPPGPAPPYMPPPHVRVYPPVGFDVASPFIYVPTFEGGLRPMPPVSPQPPVLYPAANEPPLPLPDMIVKQIDYYFSDDNLVRDSFLRSNMDEQGWVSISLIATFRRVQQLTQDIQMILDSLRSSSNVEVQGDKVRRRNEWQKWLHTGSSNNDSGASSSSPSAESALANSFQSVSLGDANGGMNMADGQEMAANRFASEELAGQPRLANGEETSGEANAIHA